jgi:hypothetical protein
MFYPGRWPLCVLRIPLYSCCITGGAVDSYVLLALDVTRASSWHAEQVQLLKSHPCVVVFVDRIVP